MLGFFHRLGGCFEKDAEFIAVFGEHAYELDAVAELGIAGDDAGEDEKGVFEIGSGELGFELEFEFELGSNREWIHALDVAAAEANVGRDAVDGSIADRFVELGVNFDGEVQLESRMLAAFRECRLRHETPLSRTPRFSPT